MGMFDDVLDNVGEEHKGGKGFELGTHEVIIGEAKAVTKKTQKNPEAAVVEVTVFDEENNDKTALCTLYFHTEGGAKMSVTKVLGILVHNVGEEKKEAVRNLGKKLFANIDDPTKARDISLKLINDKLINKKAYLVAEPRGDYKTTSYGDLWHYDAEPRSKAKEPDTILDGAKELGKDEAGEIPEFDEL